LLRYLAEREIHPINLGPLRGRILGRLRERNPRKASKVGLVSVLLYIPETNVLGKKRCNIVDRSSDCKRDVPKKDARRGGWQRGGSA